MKMIYTDRTPAHAENTPHTFLSMLTAAVIIGTACTEDAFASLTKPFDPHTTPERTNRVALAPHTTSSVQFYGEYRQENKALLVSNLYSATKILTHSLDQSKSNTNQVTRNEGSAPLESALEKFADGKIPWRIMSVEKIPGKFPANIERVFGITMDQDTLVIQLAGDWHKEQNAARLAAVIAYASIRLDQTQQKLQAGNSPTFQDIDAAFHKSIFAQIRAGLSALSDTVVAKDKNSFQEILKDILEALDREEATFMKKP